MGFVPQAIEFGVKFNFLLKMYAITWKDGRNMPYLVSTRGVLPRPSSPPAYWIKSKIKVKLWN
jgi:hypothetical protein